MKILVTGGAGFIGSHLCDELHSQGYEVWSLDNYFTGSESNHVAGVQYITGETVDIEALVDFTPDLVFHLGEYSRVEQSFSDIEKVWASNSRGTFAVLEFCRKRDCKIVYAGSSTKFADGGIGSKQSPYGWTKAANTELVQNYGTWFGLKHAIVYFYNAYGPREISQGKYATLIGLFTSKMRENLPLTVVEPGIQRRNFTHVHDIIRALVMVGEKGEGDGFGIGCDESFSVLEIANLFGGNIEMLPERSGNRISADVVSQKTRALGWAPQNKLTDYISELKKSGWKH